MKKLFYFFILIFIFFQSNQVFAQYLDYLPTSKYYNDQLSSGINNYGFTESVYSQFTGYDIFDDPNLPSSIFTNVQWYQLETLSLEALPAWAWGFELQNFTATSEESYSGESPAIGPDVDMTLYMHSFNVRMFFGDLIEDNIQAYFNIGWGFINGDFASTTATAPTESSNTSFFGFLTSRAVGAQIEMEKGVGMMVEYRALTANRTKTSNDPFDQAPGEDLYLDFSGTMINLTVYMQY